ncbi:hypothetical protein PPACK8108_LOCUS8779, partial [Phakopsora pachyrhizi]
SPTINLFPGESDDIPPANQQQRGEKRIREEVLNDSAPKDLASHLDLRLGFSQPEIVEEDSHLPKRKSFVPTNLSLEHGLDNADITQVENQLKQAKRPRSASFPYKHGPKPPHVTFDSSINEPNTHLDIRLGLSHVEIAQVGNQLSEREKLLPTSRNFEHGLKPPGVDYASAINEPEPLLDLRLVLSQAPIDQVDNQISKRKRLRPTSLTLDEGLKLPDISSTSSTKIQEANNQQVYPMSIFFLKNYEKKFFDKVKGSLVSPDKELRTERWIPSPIDKDLNIHRSLRENLKSASKINESSASKSGLFDKLQNDSSNGGKGKQTIVFESLEKASKKASAITERTSRSDIFHTIKDKHINTGASSSKKLPTKNSATLALPSPSEKDYFEAMRLARSSFKKNSQLGSIDFKIFLKNMILKEKSGKDQNFEIYLNSWRYILSETSRSYKIISSRKDVRKLFNPAIKSEDLKYVKNKEIVSSSESIDNRQLENIYKDSSTPKRFVDLKLLKQYVYDDHKFDKIIALQTLDNYVESVFRRSRKENFRSELVFGSMADLKSTYQEDTEMIKEHKSKAWSSYHQRFRLKAFPQDYGSETLPYALLTLEMGFQMGIRRLMDLNIYQSYVNYSEGLKKLLHLKPVKFHEKWFHLVILLHQIFTPFDSEAIEKLKLDLLDCSQNMFAAWEKIIGKKLLSQSILGHQAKISKRNPFLEKNFVDWFSNIIKDRNSKRFLNYGPTIILKVWLKHQYPNIFEFLFWNVNARINHDFIESYPK